MTRTHSSAAALLMFASAAALFSSCTKHPGRIVPGLESLEIGITGQSREVVYTNKEAGVFYTETQARHRSSWQGWRIMSHEMMEDYRVILDGRDLRKQDVPYARVLPHQLRRSYPSGVQERVTLLDSVNALVVELSGLRAQTAAAIPLFADAASPGDFVTRMDGSVLVIARKNHLLRTPKENFPVWIGVAIAGAGVQPNADTASRRYGTDFGPAGVRATLEAHACALIFTAGDTPEETAALARTVASMYPAMIERRIKRMETILARSAITTNDERLNLAYHWAVLSTDALIMNQVSKGIFAGLPWFDNYWGRDTFISLPGATLVTGTFLDARDILKSFADWQQTDPKSPDYGRIPNLVTTGSMAYNTTDGTPRFVAALEQYVLYSGDTAFARTLYPAVKRSIEGSLTHRVDRHFFLTHADAETWMDAVGPSGPWSPRGNRANDIQALWHRQLLAGVRFAVMAGDTAAASRWQRIAEALRKNFNAMFVNSRAGIVWDHLRADDTPDRHLRPNQLYAFPLLTDSLVRARMFDTVTRSLVYPHGVASLSQDDPNFHPWHQYAPYYVKDAAYHNGIVWTWLAGQWIDCAAAYGLSDLAYTVTANMTHQILERGAVGTLSELVDAAPRPDSTEPELSGTYSQAWSLAEYIRCINQDYFGVRVDAPAKTVYLHPALPSAITDAAFPVAAGTSELLVTYHTGGAGAVVTVDGRYARDTLSLDLQWPLANGILHHCGVLLRPGIAITFTIDEAAIAAATAAGSIPLAFAHKDRSVRLPELGGIHLATPVVRKDLPALKGPSHRLLSNAEIKRRNPGAQMLADAPDPSGDDRGTGSYTYPTTPYLRAGSLDLMRCTVSRDDHNVYFKLVFRTLSNPGWHPEYGFQLTFAALALSTGAGNPGRDLGGNSLAVMPPGKGFDRVIYVGGGLRIADSRGTTLAEYLPAPGDVSNPLGNAADGTIEFSLPVDLIGTPQKGWTITVFSGCQDDHGGAGVGEFRTVEAKAAEWTGGGKRSPRDPNVYDTMTLQLDH